MDWPSSYIMALHLGTYFLEELLEDNRTCITGLRSFNSADYSIVFKNFHILRNYKCVVLEEHNLYVYWHDLLNSCKITRSHKIVITLFFIGMGPCHFLQQRYFTYLFIQISPFPSPYNKDNQKTFKIIILHLPLQSFVCVWVLLDRWSYVSLVQDI